MSKRNIVIIVVTFVLVMLMGCNNSEVTQQSSDTSQDLSGEIFLYGETHGNAAILQKELELWINYYQEDDMRNLFIEYPYYTAEFLNVWMDSESDEILNQIFEDLQGTAADNEYTKAFFKKIKSETPETIFYGTDVGHQWNITGKRYLEYLKDNDLEESEKYKKALRVIEQGKEYTQKRDWVYRENKMTENFIVTFNQLDDKKIMGIYGSAHTGLNSLDSTGSVKSMANQLNETYKGLIQSVDLTYLAMKNEPQSTGVITINGKEYVGSYFGKYEMKGFKAIDSREFWRVEEAYRDFSTNSLTQDVLPYDNFPMTVEEEQVFLIVYQNSDGSIDKKLYRSDGNEWNDRMTTEEIETEGISLMINEQTDQSSGRIYLYGEAHGKKAILEKQVELWTDYYTTKGMRHLFIEMPYHTAELLNVWMSSSSDELFNQIFSKMDGLPGVTEHTKNFYKAIKKKTPETIFHGTDIHHSDTGLDKIYLEYLKAHDLEESINYKTAQKIIEQGRVYHANGKLDSYRENKMVENFIQAFDTLKDQDVMGIYGLAHVGLDTKDISDTVPNMGTQLSKHYMDSVESFDLTYIKEPLEPIKTQKILIGKKEYTALYFGDYETPRLKDYESKKVWRIKKAYEDFKTVEALNSGLPYNNFPMTVENGQIILVEYSKADGTVDASFLRADGDKWKGMLICREFFIDSYTIIK